MKWIQETLSQELINAMGWTLIHSIWQGGLIALGLGILFWILHRHPAQVRYLSALSALFLMFITSVGTFFYFLDPSTAEVPLSASAANLELLYTPIEAQAEVVSPQILENASASGANPDMWSEITAYFHRHLPMIVVIWLMGVLLLLLKLIGGIAYVQRLKNYRTSPVAESWRRKLDKLARRLQVSKPVRLVESAIVKTPMVIGHLKPIILLPAGLLTGLPPDQIEVVLAHELAHIRRHDYLINILQRLVELLFFYHPAVWWLSAMVRTEREHCCDDMAVGISGDSLVFAKALASIQEMGIGHPAMAMTFSGKKKQILSRVNRLLKGSRIVFSPTEGFIMAGILFFSIFLINLNASAKLEPHEAVEFMGGGIENNIIAQNDIEVQQAPEKYPDWSNSIIEEPDTIIVPSVAEVVVEPDTDINVLVDIVSPDSLPKNFSIIRNGQTFTITGKDMHGFHTVYIDSIMPKIMEMPHAISLASVAPFLADTVIGKTLRVRAAHPPVSPVALNFGMHGGYVPIAERFERVTGTFTINYEEEDRKYKTIKLTTEQGKVTSLEVNGERINSIAIDAMVAEIDREGRKFAGNQFMYNFPNEDNVFWNFGNDSTFHWNGNGTFELNSEWEEKLEKQMEWQKEFMERDLENIRRQQEDMIERQEQQRERMEERMRENEARMQEQKLRMQVQREEDQRKNEIIIDELFRDKLIDSKDEVKLKITGEKMVVNGKEQPDEILEKYIDLIGDIKGIEIDEDSNFSFSYSADEE